MTVSGESIEGNILWKSGQISPVKVWRQKARYNLVREIHAQGYNIAEIHERLGRGETSTGQVWKSHKLTLYHICKKLGLRLHTRPSWYEPLQKEALQLYEQGRTMRWIGEYFNSRGQKSVYGKPWTKKLIFALLESVPRKPSPLDDIHRDAILDGRCRGLKYSQMAEEFNRRGLPRRNNRPWTRVAIGERWHELSCKERKK